MERVIHDHFSAYGLSVFSWRESMMYQITEAELQVKRLQRLLEVVSAPFLRRMSVTREKGGSSNVRQ